MNRESSLVLVWIVGSALLWTIALAVLIIACE